MNVLQPIKDECLQQCKETELHAKQNNKAQWIICRSNQPFIFNPILWTIAACMPDLLNGFWNNQITTESNKWAFAPTSQKIGHWTLNQISKHGQSTSWSLQLIKSPAIDKLSFEWTNFYSLRFLLTQNPTTENHELSFEWTHFSMDGTDSLCFLLTQNLTTDRNNFFWLLLRAMQAGFNNHHWH